MEQGVDQIVGGGSCGVGGRDGGHGYLCGEPFKRVRNAFGGCGWDPDAVATIMVHGGTNVKTFDGMWRPCVADGGLFMNKNSGARRCKRRTIVVESAMDLGVGRELGIDTGTAEKVQGDESLGEEAIPKMQRKVGVGAAESGNEVVLERVDGAFGGVAAVDTRRGKLEIDILAAHELLEGRGCFVV